MRMRRGGEEELAALADGSLAPERRAELEARIEASPILADRLAEQERAVALLSGAGDQVEAPAGLRARLDAQRSARTVRTPRRLALGGVAAAAVAAAAIVAVVVVGSGSSGTRFQAALGPTPLARGARGQATLTRTSSGWRGRTSRSSDSYIRTFKVTAVQPCETDTTGMPASRAARQPMTSGL